MDPVRLGLSVRALRRRRRWRQADLAAAAGTSQSAVSRLERGQAGSLTLHTIQRITAPLAARLDVRLLWQGEALDRLLDEQHAALVDRVVAILCHAGWEVVVEASFAVRAERGVIDVLAHHPGTSTVLVVEGKSAVPDSQALHAGLDRKARLAPIVARERGWAAARVARLLVIADDRTARRRVERHAAAFDAAYPARGRAVLRWLRRPTEGMSGLLFLSGSRHAGTRHRVRLRAASRVCGPRSRRATRRADEAVGTD